MTPHPAQDKPAGKAEITMSLCGNLPQRILVMSDLSSSERRQYNYIDRLLRKEFDYGTSDRLPRAITRKILTLLRIVK